MTSSLIFTVLAICAFMLFRGMMISPAQIDSLNHFGPKGQKEGLGNIINGIGTRAPILTSMSTTMISAFASQQAERVFSVIRHLSRFRFTQGFRIISSVAIPHISAWEEVGALMLR